jgi:hypothetical protein
MATTEQTIKNSSSFQPCQQTCFQFFCFFMATVPNCWNRDSGNPVHVVLEQIFQDGTIEGTTQPKTI